jgi:hypothetical protein
LAGAVHNVDRSRTPVLIYAGASPFSSQNEHKGSRNEWVMWLQGELPFYVDSNLLSSHRIADIPDQPAIVRQYMRFTAQISSASTISQVVRRGLQMYVHTPETVCFPTYADRLAARQVTPKVLFIFGLIVKSWKKKYQQRPSWHRQAHSTNRPPSSAAHYP